MKVFTRVAQQMRKLYLKDEAFRQMFEDKSGSVVVLKDNPKAKRNNRKCCQS